MVKSFGAVIWRCSALTIPLVIVPSSPNGLPSATTASPTVSLVRIAERERLEHACGRVDLDDGQIGGGVAADNGGVVGRAVPEADGNRLGAVDDVLVGDDMALGVVDEARALALRLLFLAGRRGLARGDGDLDDALGRLLVDLADGQRFRRGRRRLRGGLGGGRADDRPGAAVGGEGGVGRSAAARADSGGGDERGGESDCASGARLHGLFLSKWSDAAMAPAAPKTHLKPA